MPDLPEEKEPIRGWKAVGAYIGKTDRHAQRLEKTRDLPVHRRQHLRPKVYAHDHELDRWLAGTKLDREDAVVTDPEPVPAEDDISEPEPEIRSSPRPRRSTLVSASILLLAIALLLALWLRPKPTPQKPITRAEFVVRLIDVLRESGTGPDGQPVQWPANCSVSFFQDIGAEHPLAHDCRLAYAIEQRILEGNREGETLDPDLPIMRIEAARLLMLGIPALRQHHDQHFRHHEDRCRLERICTSITELQGTEEFLDVPTFPTYQDGGWYYYHVYAITELGIMKPKSTFRFDTTGKVVRQEMEEWLEFALFETHS